MPRYCSISIDLDPIRCYYAIHALGPAPEELRDRILARCLPRFAEVFARRGLHATFFVVGQELELDGVAPADADAARAARSQLRALALAGHELGNHSYSHPYDLARHSDAAITGELERAHRLISEVAGRPVVGFRAPGYDISPAMLAVLTRLGYRYDSSIFPAPGYYGAKAAVMGALAVLGQKSGAVMTNPRALLSSPEPYRPSMTAPWRRGQASLVELPIAVTPLVRVPAIGTYLLMAPDWARVTMIASMRRRSFFNFEMHGIDLADAELDGIPGELVARQADLRVPLARKLARFESALDQIARHFAIVPLREAAAWAQREAA